MNRTTTIRVSKETKVTLDEIKQELYDSDSWTDLKMPSYDYIIGLVLDRLKDKE